MTEEIRIEVFFEAHKKPTIFLTDCYTEDELMQIISSASETGFLQIEDIEGFAIMINLDTISYLRF